MEFLKIIKRRSFLHEVVYIILNVVLALSAMVLIRVTGVYWPSLVLVLVSKWRILAVRPRFWLANIQANLVSIIVSVSYVIFLYLAQSLDSLTYNQTLIVHIILTSFYILWLLFIKPKSKRIFYSFTGCHSFNWWYNGRFCNYLLLAGHFYSCFDFINYL